MRWAPTPAAFILVVLAVSTRANYDTTSWIHNLARWRRDVSKVHQAALSVKTSSGRSGIVCKKQLAESKSFKASDSELSSGGRRWGTQQREFGARDGAGAHRGYGGKAKAFKAGAQAFQSDAHRTLGAGAKAYKASAYRAGKGLTYEAEGAYSNTGEQSRAYNPGGGYVGSGFGNANGYGSGTPVNSGFGGASPYREDSFGGDSYGFGGDGYGTGGAGHGSGGGGYGVGGYGVGYGSGGGGYGSGGFKGKTHVAGLGGLSEYGPGEYATNSGSAWQPLKQYSSTNPTSESKMHLQKTKLEEFQGVQRNRRMLKSDGLDADVGMGSATSLGLSGMGGEMRKSANTRALASDAAGEAGAAEAAGEAGAAAGVATEGAQEAKGGPGPPKRTRAKRSQNAAGEEGSEKTAAAWEQTETETGATVATRYRRSPPKYGPLKAVKKPKPRKLTRQEDELDSSFEGLHGRRIGTPTDHDQDEFDDDHRKYSYAGKSLIETEIGAMGTLEGMYGARAGATGDTEDDDYYDDAEDSSFEGLHGRRIGTPTLTDYDEDDDHDEKYGKRPKQYSNFPLAGKPSGFSSDSKIKKESMKTNNANASRKNSLKDETCGRRVQEDALRLPDNPEEVRLYIARILQRLNDALIRDTKLGKPKN